MKIGFDGKRAVCNNTGLGNYSRLLVKVLSNHYPDLEYALYTPEKRDNPRLMPLLTRQGVSVATPDKPLWKAVPALWRVAAMARQMARDGVDIIHGLSGELPFDLAASRLPSVVTVHDLIFLRLSHCFSLIDRFIYNYKCRYACKHADHIIAVSECTKRDIVHYYGIPADKISVIYQGCNPLYACRADEEKRREVKRNYRLPERYVLSVGTIEERKNTLAIVQALEHLPDELHLVLVGRPTAYIHQLKEFMAKAGLQDRVHFLHGIPSDDLPAIYQSAETFVYPSVYEGFGIPILEALHSGIPVVAATGSCLEEAGGEHSLYVSPHDVEGLAAAIARTQEPSLRATMIEEGLKWAQRFTQEQMARETMECYRKVLTKET